jgi:NlpC/P60 family putative phage cell wall peptidase
MELRDRIIAETFTWVGTRYHDQACVKGAGVDCAMLLVGVARAVGLVDPAWQPPVYSPEWHLHNNQEVLLDTLRRMGCQERDIVARQPGDILVFRYGRVASHCGVLVGPDYLVHASNADGQVVHHRLDAKLFGRLRHVFAFPEGAV